MLSLNSLIIKSSNSVFLDEIYNILYSNSIDSDPNNYQLFTKDDKFSSIFFDTYENLNFEWAYIDSCERIEDGISVIVYSYNGNLSVWKDELVKKFQNKFKTPPFVSNITLQITLDIEKSVKFKNYDVLPDWEETPVELLPEIKEKKS
jgi:hypothetical protein